VKPEDVLLLSREAQSSALVVKANFLLTLFPSTLIPAVWLDASTRPDVSDLTRVHRSEGAGDIQTYWLYTASAFFLHCDLKRPVSSSFWIRFSLPDQRSFLNLVARLKVLSLFTSPPPEWLLSPEEGNGPTQGDIQTALLEGVTMNVQHDELFVMLARWPVLWSEG